MSCHAEAMSSYRSPKLSILEFPVQVVGRAVELLPLTLVNVSVGNVVVLVHLSAKNSFWKGVGVPVRVKANVVVEDVMISAASALSVFTDRVVADPGEPPHVGHRAVMRLLVRVWVSLMPTIVPTGAASEVPYALPPA